MVEMDRLVWMIVGCVAVEGERWCAMVGGCA